jgi:hypothetical protein
MRHTKFVKRTCHTYIAYNKLYFRENQYSRYFVGLINGRKEKRVYSRSAKPKYYIMKTNHRYMKHEEL